MPGVFVFRVPLVAADACYEADLLQVIRNFLFQLGFNFLDPQFADELVKVPQIFEMLYCGRLFVAPYKVPASFCYAHDASLFESQPCRSTHAEAP